MFNKSLKNLAENIRIIGLIGFYGDEIWRWDLSESTDKSRISQTGKNIQLRPCMPNYTHKQQQNACRAKLGRYKAIVKNKDNFIPYIIIICLLAQFEPLQNLLVKF